MDFKTFTKMLQHIHPIHGRTSVNHNFYFDFLYETFQNPRTITLTHRQAGSTTFIEIYSLWKALYFAESSIIISAYQQGCSRISDDVKNLYTSIHENKKPGVNYMTKKRIIFENGASIQYISAGQKHALRGIDNNTTLFLDCHAFYDLDINDICRFKNIHSISTPNKKSGQFYKWWMDTFYSDNKSHNTWTCSRMVVEDMINLGLNSKFLNRIDELREILGKNRFNSDYCGVFLPSEEKTELIHIRVTEYEKIKIQEEADVLGFRNISEYARFKMLN